MTCGFCAFSGVYHVSAAVTEPPHCTRNSSHRPLSSSTSTSSLRIPPRPRRLSHEGGDYGGNAASAEDQTIAALVTETLSEVRRSRMHGPQGDR